jgi:hypothetical protein
VESVVFNGGAVSAVSSLATTGAITSVGGDLIVKADATTTTFSVTASSGAVALAADVAAITHTGATSFTISSTGTAGDVTVESVVFDGGAVSGVTSITTGDATGQSKLSGVTMTNGAVAGVSSLATTGAITSVAGDLTIKADATTSKFTVTAASGNTDIQGDLNVAGTTTVASGTYSGSWVAASDARWKHRVQTMSGSLDAVMAMRPVHYEWRADSPAAVAAARRGLNTTALPLQVGFIAQEVREALPANVSDTLVSEVDAEGHLGVEYSKLTAVLVGAVQEQQETIAQHEQTIAQHEQTIAQHELELQEIRRQLAQLQEIASELLQVGSAEGRRA